MKHPEDVMIMVDGQAAGRMTFAQFVRHVLDGDDRANSTGPAIRAGMRIEAAIAATKPGDVIRLEAQDRTLLADIADAPQGGYPAILLTSVDGTQKARSVGRQLTSFIDACRIDVEAKTEPAAANGTSEVQA